MPRVCRSGTRVLPFLRAPRSCARDSRHPCRVSLALFIGERPNTDVGARRSAIAPDRSSGESAGRMMVRGRLCYTVFASQTLVAVLPRYADRRMLDAVRYELGVKVVEGSARPSRAVLLAQNTESVKRIQHSRPAGAGQAGDLAAWQLPACVEPLKRAPIAQREHARDRDNALDQSRIGGLMFASEPKKPARTLP